MRTHKVWWWVTAVSLLLFFIITSLTHAQGTPTPTIDRLAAPPTVPSPTQADEGAQLFWLHCQPCHGDQGQGLTDEWRAQFPEEEQYCWKSGCHGEHGKDPPDTGFMIPTAVPAVIGEGSLARFQSVQQLFYFIRTSMPYENPGGLKEEEYLAITAYIARAHGVGNGVGNGVPLTEANVAQVQLRPGENIPQTTATPEAGFIILPLSSAWPVLLFGSSLALVFLIGVAWLWYRQRQ